MQSDTYTAALERGLRSTISKLKSALDPILKEKRTFPVVPANELCRDIASSLIKLGREDFPGRDRYSHDIPSYSGRTTRWRTHVDFNIPPSDAAQVFMAPFYTVLAPLSGERYDAGSSQLLTVKTSTNTRIGGTSMRDHISNLVGAAKLSKQDGTITFTDVVQHADKKLYNQLFGIEKNVSDRFLKTITETALQGNYQNTDIVDEVRQLASDFPRDTRLNLRSRTYVARADTRAYYVDTDPIRHLAASIVQAVIQGPKGYVHGFGAINQILPPKGKNIIDWTLEIGEHEVLQLVTGDIGGFTNSNVNTWVTALAMYHRLLLQDVEHLNKPVLANVAGTLLEFTILDVLRSFLYLTVGSTANIGGDTFVAPGGFLGVKANMRLTCLSFVACLREIETKVLQLFAVKMKSQIGGDDFTLALIGMLNNVSHANSYIREQIARYVGNLKEFISETISLQPSNEGHTSLVFCKKDLAWTRMKGPRQFRVYSIRKLPIMSQLIEHTEMNVCDRIKDFLSFRNGVIDTLRTLESPAEFVAGYEQAYRSFHHFPTLVVSKRFIAHVTDTDLVEFGGQLVTRSIQQRLNSLGPFKSTTGNVTLSERELLSVLSFDPRVVSTEAITIVSGTKSRITYHNNETPTTSWEQAREFLLYEETEIGNTISRIFQQFRSDVDFL